MTSFTATYGHVQYKRGNWKSVTGQCELCERITTLVRDHCHKHGFIRGLICNPCNRIIGRHEKGWITYRFLFPVHVNYLNNCPECRKEQTDNDE